MNRKLLITLCLLLAFYQQLLGQKATISGYIRDADTRESLIGANVFDLRKSLGSSSNTYGFFSLTLPVDSVNLNISYVGYQGKSISFYLRKDTVLDISLSARGMMDEIVVSAEKYEAIQEVSQMSSINVPIEQIKSLPALLGEVDVLKILQLLPGVQSGNEGTSGLYVRGGGPDQNLILLDGVPVYNVSHLFGFFSVFNADAINNVQLIKGGFPARYGGRLSSVLDISMKEGNMQRFQAEGSVGIVASRLTLEGPIIKDKTSFIVSGRRTYIDVLTRPLTRLALQGNGTAGYYFYDLNAKINHKFSDRSRLFLSSYMGDDRAFTRFKDFNITSEGRTDINTQFGLNWGNLTAALRWNYVINPKFFSNTTLTYSRYRFDVGVNFDYLFTPNSGPKQEQIFANRYFSGIEDLGAKVDFEYVPNPNHFIRFGTNYIHHTFNPGVTSVRSGQAIDTTFGATKLGAHELAFYVEDDFKIGSRLKINPGLHFSVFQPGSRVYTSLQPRFSGRYLLSDKVSLKASYANMAQFIHLLTNSGIGLPTDLWVPSTDRIAPQRSWQVAAGIAYNLGNNYEFSVEGYYKEMFNLIEYKEGASFIDSSGDWQDKVEVGDGDSYGAEVFLQKKKGRLTGWIGYTLSWTNRQFDNLNFGRPFPYKYDRRHDIGIATVYDVSEKIDVSGTWVYGTGNALSLPNAIYPVGDGNSWPFFAQHYGERNSFRMAAYHRLDLSINFKTKKPRGYRTWSFGLYNAYSRMNPFFVDLSYDRRGNRRFIQYSLFPVIPAVSYNFKFTQ